MKYKILFLSFILSCTSMFAQKAVTFSSIDNTMLQIPDSCTKSTQSIARYINSRFITQNDRARAAFYWVTRNIQYDVKNMYTINFYESETEIIDKVLATRKGVCMSYAALFTDIAIKTGIRAYRIEGYTRQNGFTDYIPHAWVAARIDTNWYLFDPTWAAGYLSNSKFVSQLNNAYWKTKPEEMIKSHMPFDPLWQLLSYTVTNAEFNQGKTTINTKKSLFNFNDSIAAYEKQNEIERLASFTGRLEKNGISNSLLFDRYQYNKREIDYLRSKQFTDLYNKAVNDMNEGVNALNGFINYRNRQFTPAKSDAELKLMLENIETQFTNSKLSLDQIKDPDANAKISVNQLNHSIEEATKNLSEQKTFLTKYLSTSKIFRKSMFYKYSWMGIPLN